MVAGRGVEASHVSVLRYETGKRMPPADYIAVFSMIAGVSVEWLLYGHGPRMRPAQEDANAYARGVDEVTRALIADAVAARENAGLPPLPSDAAQPPEHAVEAEEEFRRELARDRTQRQRARGTG